MTARFTPNDTDSGDFAPAFRWLRELLDRAAPTGSKADPAGATQSRVEPFLSTQPNVLHGDVDIKASADATPDPHFADY